MKQIDIETVWDLVKGAADDGTFVPVLGPELAADPRFTQAPPSASKFYSQDNRLNASQQRRELAAIWLHQSRLTARIRSPKTEPSAIAFWPKLRSSGANETGPRIESLAVYLENLSWPGARVSDRDGHEPQCLKGSELLYEDFLCDLPLLALSLKRAWNGSLMNDPRPLSAVGPDTLLAERGRLVKEKIPYVFAACLESCRRLLSAESQDGPWEEPNGLQLQWVYCKLLLLGSQVFGSPDNAKDLWDSGPKGIGLSSPDFVAQHAVMINDLALKEQERTTGWLMDESGLPEAAAVAHGFKRGLRLTHVLWVESLVRHALLAGTRAYRTSGQLAFLLSLDDKVRDLPGMSVDPFEVGLLHPAEANRDLEVVKGIYEFAERSVAPDGSLAPRLPGAFHQAIARIIWNMVNTSGKKAKTVSGSKRRTNAVSTGPESMRALILTMALDTEMERALEQVFDSYRVLIPVFLLEEEKWRGTWVLAKFTLREDAPLGRREFLCAAWTPVTRRTRDQRNTANVEGEGPLLIKLFGSPLANVGDSVEIRPRVVLDERELLGLLKESIPMQVSGLEGKFGGSNPFFFGQNATKWSDRIPYLMVAALRESRPESESRMDDADAETLKSPASKYGEYTSLVAFAERSEYGDSLFDRLNVTRNSANADVGVVARAIMQGVATDRSEEDPHGRV